MTTQKLRFSTNTAQPMRLARRSATELNRWFSAYKKSLRQQNTGRVGKRYAKSKIRRLRRHLTMLQQRLVDAGAQ